MSVYSDYKCGAMSDAEYSWLSNREYAQDEPEYPVDEEEDQIEAVKARMCKEYCKYPNQVFQEELDAICDECPLNDI